MVVNSYGGKYIAVLRKRVFAYQKEGENLKELGERLERTLSKQQHGEMYFTWVLPPGQILILGNSYQERNQ